MVQSIDDILVREGPVELDVEKIIDSVMSDRVLENNVQATMDNVLNDIVQNFNILTEDEYSNFKGGLETYGMTRTNVRKMIDKDVSPEDIKEYILGNIESLEKQSDEFYNKALEYKEKNEEAHKEYFNAGEVLSNEAELLRFKFDIKPEEQRTIDKIKKEAENNPLVRLDKFKNYIRENWKEIGLIGSLALSTVGVILNLVSVSRKQVLMIAQATKKTE